MGSEFCWEYWNYQTRNLKQNVMDMLMDKADNMQEQMNNVSKEMEILESTKG